MMVAMELVGVRIEMPSNQPIVLLKEVAGSRFLPIWVGAVEATAIAFAQQGLAAQRPLTHDLLANILEIADLTTAQIHITELRDGVFYSEIHLRDKAGALLKVSARPSDAIALALRTESEILADSELLDTVGIDIPERLIATGDEISLSEGGDLGEAGSGGAADSELEKFREFLDQINPDDFAG